MDIKKLKKRGVILSVSFLLIISFITSATALEKIDLEVMFVPDEGLSIYCVLPVSLRELFVSLR